MGSERGANIVEWIVLLVPVGGVLLLGWLVIWHSCSAVPAAPGDVAAPGGETRHERPSQGGAS